MVTIINHDFSNQGISQLLWSILEPSNWIRLKKGCGELTHGNRYFKYCKTNKHGSIVLPYNIWCIYDVYIWSIHVLYTGEVWNAVIQVDFFAPPSAVRVQVEEVQVSAASDVSWQSLQEGLTAWEAFGFDTSFSYSDSRQGWGRTGHSQGARPDFLLGRFVVGNQ